MLNLILFSFLISVTYTFLKKKYKFKWMWQAQQTLPTSTISDSGPSGQKTSNGKNRNLLEYYSSLDFKPVSDLELIPVNVTFPEHPYKTSQKVYYQNKKKLQEKIAFMKQLPNDQIQLLADFDHTISSREINGKFNTPTMGIFRESKVMPENFKKQLSDLFKYYYPIEKDVTIPEDQKIEIIEEWYRRDNNITSDQNITLEKIIEVLEQANVGFRHKSKEFLKMCKDNNLYLSVVSGGCSDIIATMMNQIIELGSYEEFMIYSNEMVIQDNKLKKYNMKINSVGKKMVINNKKLSKRKNILVYGDILADVNMVSNVEYDNLIAIGFLNKPKTDQDLSQYLEKFDVVIVNDGSFKVPNEILSEIISVQ